MVRMKLIMTLAYQVLSWYSHNIVFIVTVLATTVWMFSFYETCNMYFSLSWRSQYIITFGHWKVTYKTKKGSYIPFLKQDVAAILKNNQHECEAECHQPEAWLLFKMAAIAIFSYLFIR
jgi:glucose dehydrogenase